MKNTQKKIKTATIPCHSHKQKRLENRIVSVDDEKSSSFSSRRSQRRQQKTSAVFRWAFLLFTFSKGRTCVAAAAFGLMRLSERRLYVENLQFLRRKADLLLERKEGKSWAAVQWHRRKLLFLWVLLFD